MELQSEIIEKLTWRGILAYVAVSLAGHAEATTAALAGLVKAASPIMREGLEELSVVAPTLCRKAPKNKWGCGEIKAGEGTVVQNLDCVDSRRKEFLDEVKKIYEWANPGVTFTMNSADGAAVSRFLKQYKDWDRLMWQRGLRNRFLSEVSKSQPLYMWLGKLVEYLDTPLDRYGKPMENGGGRHGETATVRQRNREAVEQAVAHAE